MPNNITITEITSPSKLWEVSYNVDSAGAKIANLMTSGTFLDRNIGIKITTPPGNVTGPSSLSGSGATLSTGTNTLTFTKQGIDTTPTVTAGYVTTATSSSATITLTASVTTKEATIYNVSTVDQTISGNQYLTGTQTIRKVTTNNIDANKIKSGVIVTVGDSGSATRIKNVTGTFTSSNTVSSGQTAAKAAHILTGYSAWVDGEEVQGALNGSASQTATVTVTGSGTATTPTITRITTGASNVGSGNASTTAPTSGYFVAMKATAPATTLSITKTVNQAGLLTGENQITATATTSAKDSDTYYITVPSGGYSASVSSHTITKPTVTPSIGGNITDITQTSTPSGTNGTDYWTIDPDGSVTTNGSSKTKAKATISSGGYIPAGSDTSPESSITLDRDKITIAAGQSLYIPKATFFSNNGEVTVKTAGYIPANTTVGSFSAATVVSGAGTATIGNPTYNSTNSNFVLTASGSVAAPSVSTAGYISNDIGTKTGNTISGSKTLNKISLTSERTSGNLTKAPTLARTAKPSGDTWTDAANGSATTTKPTSGPYVQIDAAASTNTVTIKGKVSADGYGTTTQYVAANTTYTVGAAKATTRYIPIKTTSRTAGDGIVTLGVGNGDSASSSNTSMSMTTTTPSSGVYYTLTATGRGAVSTGAGWVISGSTTSNTATTYGYITKSINGSSQNGAPPAAADASTAQKIQLLPNSYVMFPAGYNPLNRYVWVAPAGSSDVTQADNFSLAVSDTSGITGGSAVTIGNKNTTTGLYPVTANNLQVTATLTAGAAGWFSTGSATDTDVDSVTIGTINEAALTASGTASATTTVAPGTVSIAKGDSISGKTKVDIAPTTSTSGISTYYIPIKAKAAANTTGTTSSISGTANASVSTPGYAATTTTGTGSISGTATAKTSEKSSNNYVIPLPTAQGSVTMSAGNGSCIVQSSSYITLSDSNTSGVSVTFRGSGSVSATAKIITAGYTGTNNSFATGSSTSSNTADLTKYITGVELTKGKSFSIKVPNGPLNSDGTNNNTITFVFTVANDNTGNVTIAGPD